MGGGGQWMGRLVLKMGRLVQFMGSVVQFMGRLGHWKGSVGRFMGRLVLKMGSVVPEMGRLDPEMTGAPHGPGASSRRRKAVSQERTEVSRGVPKRSNARAVPAA